jgi:hypothetical protein
MKNIVDFILNKLLSTYVGALFLIFIGIIIIRYTIRKPDEKGFPVNYSVQGWAAGIGFIILGIIVIIHKLFPNLFN